MSTNENLTEIRSFLIPAIAEGDFTNEELSEEMDGLSLGFQRIKIPSGGIIQFEIPTDDPENPNYEKAMIGILLHHHSSNAYWPGEKIDENTPPQCSSMDGKIGIGNPGGACAACPMNEYESDSRGRGKACKNMRVLYLLRDGDILPMQLSLPPTSLKPFNDFYNLAFASRRRCMCGSVVQIGLKKMSNGKDDYSVATFKKLCDFSGEDLANAKAYADSFKEQVKLLLRQREEENLARADSEDDTEESNTYTVLDGNGKFVVTSGGIKVDSNGEVISA